MTDKVSKEINPIYSYNGFIDIIAVNNLPSLLPRESSIYFSKKLVQLLLHITPFIDIKSEVWAKNERIFYEKIATI